MEIATIQDLARLERLRAREVDSWVQSVLDRTIRAIRRVPTSSPVSQGSWEPTSSQQADDIQAQAIQHVSSVMLHELRPLVDDVYRATRAIDPSRFEDSAASRAILRLREFLATMHRLHDAAEAPRFGEFDLVAFLRGEVIAGGYEDHQIIVARSDVLVVNGDADLLRFAVQNCIRNAVEASTGSSEPVLLLCGSNQDETWVVVLDEGIGLPQDKDRLLEPGTSMKSKIDHFGMGLPIASRAMRSMAGNMELVPREFGGTACELRWPNQIGLV